MHPKILAAFMAAVLLGATAARAVPPGAIAVVCDLNVAPYRAFVEGFRKASTLPVRVIPCAEAARPGFEEWLRREGVRGVAAVGLQPCAAVDGLRELPVLRAMAPLVQRWTAEQANRYGLEMMLSPRQHLETIRRVFPRARRVGVVFDPAQTGGYVHEALSATGLGLTLVTREMTRPSDLSRHLAALRDQVDVIWLLPDTTVLHGENLDLLLLASFESHIPLYGFARKYVELGAVAAAHFDPEAMGTQAAGMLATALDRAPEPAAARRQYAIGARLVVNQKIARKLGLDLDPHLLERADDVLR